MIQSNNSCKKHAKNCKCSNYSIISKRLNSIFAFEPKLIPQSHPCAGLSMITGHLENTLNLPTISPKIPKRIQILCKFRALSTQYKIQGALSTIFLYNE